MTKRLLKTIIGMLSFSFWAIILFGFNTPFVAILTIIAALIHEGGHLLALIGTGSYTGLPRFVISGFRLRRAYNLSYREEIIVLLSGSLSNFLAFALLLVLYFPFGRYFGMFALLNLFTGISNLLPVWGYDGYKIISAIIDMHPGGRLSAGLLSRISLGFVIFMTFLSLYLIMKVGDGYFIFAVFFFSMLVSLFSSLSDKKREFKRY